MSSRNPLILYKQYNLIFINSKIINTKFELKYINYSTQQKFYPFFKFVLLAIQNFNFKKIKAKKYDIMFCNKKEWISLYIKILKHMSLKIMNLTYVRFNQRWVYYNCY